MWRAFARSWTAGLVVLFLAAGCAPRSGSVAPPTDPSASHASPSASGPPGAAPTISHGPGVVTKHQPPKRAREALAEILRRHGEPPPGYVGGRIFQNREHKLPPGTYREYDVNPTVSGRDRGPERIVLEVRTGKAYFTDDHYRDFLPMN